MKVYNLTDVETGLLRRRSMVNVAIKVGETVIRPGTCAVLPNKASLQSFIQQNYAAVGALSIDGVPSGYTGTAAGAPAPAPQPPPPDLIPEPPPTQPAPQPPPMVEPPAEEPPQEEPPAEEPAQETPQEEPTEESGGTRKRRRRRKGG